MKEVIIYSQINQFALLRQLAMYGVNTVGYRILNNNAILSYIEEKTGNLISKGMINNQEKAYLFTRFLKEDQSYFKGSTYEAAKTLSITLDSIRLLIEEDEENVIADKLLNSDKSKNKYEAIYNIYKKYKEYLDINNIIDEIQKIRELIKLNIKIDLDVVTIKGEELSPLHKKLLENIFNSVKEVELRELFNRKKVNADFKNLFKSKGYSHEVANVFKIIAENKLPFDTCTIVYTANNNFYNSIKEYSNLLSVPVTYGDGVPAIEYNAYRMLYLVVKLNDGLYGYDVLMDLLKDKSFNYSKLIQELGQVKELNKMFATIGDLKFSFDADYNDKVFSRYKSYHKDYLKEIEYFKDIFNKGIINLIREYVVDDNPSITNSLLNELELYKSFNDIDDFDFFKSLLTTSVNGSMAKEGSIITCSLLKATTNIRQNMFFIGNDNDSFHISLAENSFISDDKLREFNAEFASTSLNMAKKKIENYKNTMQLAFDLGSNVYVSYCEKDEFSELKNHNCISILFDLQKDSEPGLMFEDFKKRFVSTCTYYGNNLRSEEKLIESYIDKTNSIIAQEEIMEQEDRIECLIDKRYAPTQIEDNIKCRKYFLINRILGVNTLNNYDVFAKFANTDIGNMFHEVMKFANEGKTLDEVNNKAEEIFDSVCAKRNPILHVELDKDKKEFLEIVSNGYKYLQKKKQGIAEQWQETDVDINGVTLHLEGKPDLISDKEIIDYKAKGKVMHKEEDIDSCIQALIYALMNSDKKIDHVEYYYPLFNKYIKTNYDEVEVKDRLNKFINSIINNDFKPAIEVYADDKNKLEDICKYCNYKDICGRE